MDELTNIEELKGKGQKMLELLQAKFPSADKVSGTIGTVPNDPEYISLTLCVEFHARMV